MEKGHLGGKSNRPTRKGTSVQMNEEQNSFALTAVKVKARSQNDNWQQSTTIKWHLGNLPYVSIFRGALFKAIWGRKCIQDLWLRSKWLDRHVLAAHALCNSEPFHRNHPSNCRSEVDAFPHVNLRHYGKVITHKTQVFSIFIMKQEAAEYLKQPYLPIFNSFNKAYFSDQETGWVMHMPANDYTHISAFL